MHPYSNLLNFQLKSKSQIVCICSDDGMTWTGNKQLPEAVMTLTAYTYMHRVPGNLLFSYYFLFSPLFHTAFYFFLFFSSNLLLTLFFLGMQKKKKKYTSKNMHLPHNMCFMIIACAYRWLKIIFNGYEHPLRWRLMDALYMHSSAFISPHNWLSVHWKHPYILFYSRF